MTIGLVERTVWTNGVPESVRVLGSLPEVDYADLFTLFTDTEALPEQWARATFGDIPGLAELLIWRGLLGLRLGRGRSPATVAGWRLGRSMWPPLSAIHRRVVPGLLRDAAARAAIASPCADRTSP
jgi:hypothetical protein